MTKNNIFVKYANKYCVLELHVCYCIMVVLSEHGSHVLNFFTRQKFLTDINAMDYTTNEQIFVFGIAKHILVE